MIAKIRGWYAISVVNVWAKVLEEGMFEFGETDYRSENWR